MTFIERFARECAKLNASGLTVSKGPSGVILVRYFDKVLQVEDASPLHEKTLGGMRAAIDELMGRSP